MGSALLIVDGAVYGCAGCATSAGSSGCPEHGLEATDRPTAVLDQPAPGYPREAVQ